MNRIPADKVELQPSCGRCNTSLQVDGGPLHLDDNALQRLVRASPVPVLVDFYADWCAPCKALAPVLDELGRKHAGALIVAKVDTEQNPRMATSLGVQGIPAVFLYQSGEVVADAAGARPLQAYEQMVAPYLTP